MWTELGKAFHWYKIRFWRQNTSWVQTAIPNLNARLHSMYITLQFTSFIPFLPQGIMVLKDPKGDTIKMWCNYFLLFSTLHKTHSQNVNTKLTHLITANVNFFILLILFKIYFKFKYSYSHYIISTLLCSYFILFYVWIYI